jgi:uncharacterized linocin/CFP29 family protein
MERIYSAPADIDIIQGGKAMGQVGQMLLQNNLDVGCLRTNATLTHEQWIQIDRVVIQEALRRLTGVNDLITRGLTAPGGGLGKTVHQWQDASDTDDAVVNMDGITRGQRDRQEFDTNFLPMPIIHKNFSFSIRELSAENTQPLDTTMAETSARKVSEKLEDILFNGLSAYTFGGGTIRGYTDHPDRNTVTLSQNWDASGKTGQEIVTDILNMKQAAINDRHYGPYMLYIPTAYETVLDDSFSTQYAMSIRERIMQISSIIDIKVSDFLSANNVVLVSMQSDVIRLINSLDITTVQWDSEGGLQQNFKIMAIMINTTGKN